MSCCPSGICLAVKDQGWSKPQTPVPSDGIGRDLTALQDDKLWVDGHIAAVAGATPDGGGDLTILEPYQR